MNGLLPHVLEARRGPLVEHREVQEEGQDPGARGEEEVGGHTEFLRHVQRDAAEEVEHEHGRGRGGQELAEVRVGDADELEGERLVVLGLDGREALDLGQAVEGDGRVGRGDAGEERPRGARVVGRLDDDDCDGQPPRAEDLAKLDHGDQVAHPWRRVQHNRSLGEPRRGGGGLHFPHPHRRRMLAMASSGVGEWRTRFCCEK